MLTSQRFSPLVPAVVLAVLSLATPAQSPPQPQRYAVLVGINTYDNSVRLPPLHYAVTDATEMARLLVRHGYKVTLLTDSRPADLDNVKHDEPTRANIVGSLQQALKQFRKGDTLLVALAGHGLQFKNDKTAYFCPRDAKVGLNQTETLLSIKDDFYEPMEEVADGFKILLVDACRNDPTEIIRGGVNAGNAPTAQGVWAYFSCSEGETSAESGQLEHGVFFYSVLEVLRGKAGRDPKDGWVRGGLLLDNVPRMVEQLRGKGKQKPNLKTNWRGDSPEFVCLPDGPSPPGRPPPVERPLKRTFGFKGRPASEQDLVPVRLPGQPDLWVGSHEVSQGLYRAVMGGNPSKYKNGGSQDVSEGNRDESPVEHVTPDDAEKFCKELSRRDPDYNFRLPTAREMLFLLGDGDGKRAAGKAGLLFTDSSSDLLRYVNHDKNDGNAAFPRFVKCGGAGAPKWCVEPSPGLKLHHILGNVAEWCKDEDGSYHAAGGSSYSREEDFFEKSGRVLPGKATRARKDSRGLWVFDDPAAALDPEKPARAREDPRCLVGIRVIAEPKKPR
jgi:formylglycine-generating enzyme required for sulfatase activity